MNARINKLGKQWTVFIPNQGFTALATRQEAIAYAVDRKYNVRDSQGRKVKGTPWFVDRLIDLKEVPRDCIADCSAQGQVDESVAYWRKKLDMRLIDLDSVREYLRDCGFSVDKPDLTDVDENEQRPIDDFIDDDSDTLAERILWLACCEFNDYLRWRSENPKANRENCSQGSDEFYIGT